MANAFLLLADKSLKHEKKLLFKMENVVHIGEAIKTELKKQEHTVTWLANHLGVTRATCYRIFDSYSIDTQMLQQISILLHRDFFSIYSEKIKLQVYQN